MKRPMLAVFLAAVLLAACSPGERVAGPTPQRGARTTRNHPAETSTTRESAASVALRTPLYVDPSFLEFLLIPSDTPTAVAYPFDMDRGERFEISVEPQDGAAEPVLDVFEHLGGAIYRFALARRGPAAFEFEAPTRGRYLLRIQPAAGGGRYRVSVRGQAASVQFPVAGHDASAIRSAYGEDRDAGVRSHEGVDIFAPRGTPVLSVSEAVVEAVQNTRLGGRVVWARDAERDVSYYYAHLETQNVKRGQRIQPGDTIGTVGNSGNAKGASPHLHFGVYRGRTIALNPLPLLGRRSGELVVAADTLAAVQLGLRAVVGGDAVRLRGSPDAAGAVLAQLPAGTRLRIMGVIGDWRRVVLEDGRTGFVASRLLQPATLSAQ